MRCALFVVVCLAAVASASCAGRGETAVPVLPTEGLVAHWDFDDGSGNVLRDSSGHGTDGTVMGAAWVESDSGCALKFDGVDDYVDCGAGDNLNIEAGGAVVLWFRPEALQGALVARTTGPEQVDRRLLAAFKQRGTARLFQYYLTDGEQYHHGNLQLPKLNAWSHLAMTFDGEVVNLYQDGVLTATTPQNLTPKLADIPLMIGRGIGLDEGFFKGLIDELLIYNRALSHDDIIALYKSEAVARGRSTEHFIRPGLKTTAYADSGKLLVRVNYSAMRPAPSPSAAFEVAVVRGDSGKRVAEVRLPVAGRLTFAEAFLDLQDEPPGAIEVSVHARDAAGEKIGIAAVEELEWPERDPRFSPAKGVRVLNNFVFELLNVESPGAKEFTIHNPREGWLYVAFPGHTGRLAGTWPRVRIGAKEYRMRHVGDKWETMRYITEGPHKVTVAGGFRANGLIIRSIGELFYNMYGANPLVPETADYTWEWLRKHVLDHYNCVIGRALPDKFENEIKEWASEGKRWYTQRGLPWVKTAEEAYEYWAGQMGMTHPLMHGIWADEFSPGEKYRKMYPVWGEALRRISANPRFKGRKFYAYMGMTYNSGYDPLTRTIMECGYRLAPEWYVREVPSVAKIRGYFGPEYERNNRANYEAGYPGAANNRVAILGLLSQPEESCDIYPHCNYNVYLDLQFHFLANDPAFFGTRGLQGYYSPYVGEEQTRVFARLIRHYAIEGNTERMLKDPYSLSHLDNPDFTEGTNGWTLSAADEGSIAAKTAEGFGFLQARFVRIGVGDTVLWTKRSNERPNVFSQSAKDLEPGRLYSLRFFTGNYQDYLKFKSRAYRHGTSVTIENVDLIPEKCFQAMIKSCYAHEYKSFNQDNHYRMNYYQRVFRAKGKTARLIFSDWASDTQPGGADGAELIWNFIQVQPYFAEQ